MAITDENGGMTYNMPVTPAYGMGGGFGNNFGGEWAWIILLLLCFNGGWGMGGFGGGYGAMMGADFGGFGLYPWLNNSQNINNGFRDQMLNSSVQGIQNSITSGFGDVQLGIAGVNQNICNTGNGIVNAVSGAQNAITAQMYTNQIADLERSFAAQTANTQGMTALQAQLAQCCCDNRLATNDLKYTIATENCADRAAVNDGIRDIITNQTANTQSIIDKLCQLELDGYKRENDNLRSQLNMATLRESQTAQNAFIQQGFSDEVDQLYNRLNNCPVPTTPVYGRTPIFTCNQNNGCGCGCGQF